MTAADFWRFIPTACDASSPRANRQTSPGITHSPSRLCLSDRRFFEARVLCGQALRLISRLKNLGFEVQIKPLAA
jgi:hypothetical protein